MRRVLSDGAGCVTHTCGLFCEENFQLRIIALIFLTTSFLLCPSLHLLYLLEMTVNRFRLATNDADTARRSVAGTAVFSVFRVAAVRAPLCRRSRVSVTVHEGQRSLVFSFLRREVRNLLKGECALPLRSEDWILKAAL